MSFVVGIDGPAGSGKGTITSIIAKELGLINIDTGATYRCVALETLNRGIKLEDKENIIKLVDEITIEIIKENGQDVVLLNGQDVTKSIRTKEVTGIVSQVSSIPEVRFKLVELQRKMAEGKNVIMEGRDICTYVFPNADVKIYLDASFEERAKRRFEENKQKGILMTYEEVLENIKLRDENDKNKPIGALKMAEDSVLVDTTKLSIEEVTEKIINIIKEKMNY